MSLYSHPCLHPLYASFFFFCLSLSGSTFFIHTGLLAFLPDFVFFGESIFTLLSKVDSISPKETLVHKQGPMVTEPKMLFPTSIP